MEPYQYKGYQEVQGVSGAGAYFDDAEGQPKSFSFDDQSIRLGFIRKVYLILMGQLMITFGAVAVIAFSDQAKAFALLNPWLIWLAMGFMIVTMLSMICCENVRRQTPTNFIFLGIFTVAESFLLAVAATRYAPRDVLLAIGITAAICLALTLFAMHTKYDLTMMGGVLIACLVSLVIFGFVAIFVGGRITSMIYACLGAVLFSVYLIYDTQLMLGGNHKYTISPEEYIFATLNLYLDIINIFMDILNIIGVMNE